MADWSRIGGLFRDWLLLGTRVPKSYFIVQLFFTDRIDIELADWSWIANGLVNWLRIVRWVGV